MFATTFSIFDHIEKLELVRQGRSESRFICPSCQGNNLAITNTGNNTGRFVCYSGCSSAQIREAIAPLNRTSYHRGSGRKVVPIKVASLPPVGLPEIDSFIARIPPENILATRKGNNIETIYPYSSSQWVTRVDYYDNEGLRTRKATKPWHISIEGKNINSKGDELWPLYRKDECNQYASGGWVLGVEGEKCVEALRSLGLCSFTSMGSGWNVSDLELGLLSLKEVGAIAYLPDNDAPGEKKSLAIAAAARKVGLPCLILNLKDLWPDMPVAADVHDWIATNTDWNQEEFVAKMNGLLADTADAFTKNFEDYFDQGGGDKPIVESWCESEFSDLIADCYRDTLAWDIHQQQWLRYGEAGIWEKEFSDSVELICELKIKQYRKDFCSHGRPHPISRRFCAGVERKLRAKLTVRAWDEIKGMIPLKNGVLNPSSLELTEHCPGNRLTWCLPYPYVAIALATPIIDWFTTQINDEGTIEVLRAYLYAIACSKYEWQQYLELIGRGGTGKGTYVRLAQALIGVRNCHSTKLQKLETSSFESASLKSKKLCIIADSEKFVGEVSLLKAMTGGDLLPYEKKFQQSTSGFIFEGMIIIASNESLSTSDHTSGLERRRISIRLDKQVERKNQRCLLDFKANGESFGEFADSIPGLLNWVLQLGESRAKELLKNHCEASRGLELEKAYQLTETNPLAAWADEFLVQSVGTKTYVGVAQQIRYTLNEIGQSESWTGYKNMDSWLYASYASYAQNTGINRLAQKRFTSLLLDLLAAQLKLKVIKGTDRRGSFFGEIKLRDGSDVDTPFLITKMLSDIPTVAAGATECDGKTTKCDGSVMANVMVGIGTETGCDGSDGTNTNSLSPYNMQENLLGNSPDNIASEKVMFVPSHPSHIDVAALDETVATPESQAALIEGFVPSHIDVAIASRNESFPVGSYVRYYDPIFSSQEGDLAQVTQVNDWSPDYIDVAGEKVTGSVQHRLCRKLSKVECFELQIKFVK